MKHVTIRTLALLFAMAIFAFVSCEGPEGPIGETGEQGEVGPQGEDASLYCASCHNLDKQGAIELQLAASAHGTMPNKNYAGGRAGCAKCHSHQGFVETTFTGQDATAADPAFPMALTCESCHDSHVTLDPEEGPDYALRYKAPVSFMIDEHNSSFDFPGNSNTCAYCHQPRWRDGFPLDPANTSTTHAVTSSHWGPHHSPQATVFIGKFGFEVAGTTPYPSTDWKHGGKDCAFCHMIEEPNDDQKGGHTFKVDEQTCSDCHGGTEVLSGVRTEVTTLLTSLKDKLVALHLLHEADGEVHVAPSADGKGSDWTNDEAGLVFNYLYVAEDLSKGIHNPPYVKALLKNSIAKADDLSHK